MHIYIHIHKSGGTTLMNLLDRVYRDHTVFSIDGTQYKKSIEDLKNQERPKYDLIKGHQFYGIHKSLRQPNVKYFTMLREPLSRVISLYNYLKNIDLYPEINEQNMSLIHFIKSGLALAADNGMTRFIAGVDVDEESYGKCSETTLEKAISHISHPNFVVGLSEYFDASILLFEEMLAWERRPYYVNRNVTKKRFINFEDLSTEELTFLQAWLAPDIALYEQSKKKFFNDLEAYIGIGLERKKNYFKAQNKAWKMATKLKQSLS